MVANAKLISTPTLANVNLVSKARIVRSILMIAFFVLVKMTELVSITLMISCAFANLRTLEKLVKSKWILVILTIVPMEQLVLQRLILKIMFVLVLSDSLVDFVMKILTSVL